MGSDRSLAKLNRLVHEPARLALLTALSECTTADFTFLRQVLGLTAGNLSAHLTALEAGKLVSLRKEIRGRTVHTAVSLTAEGRTAIKTHWQQLDALRAAPASPQFRALLRRAARLA